MIYIEEGEKLSAISLEGDRYAFEYVQFKGLPVVDYNPMMSLSDIGDVRSVFPEACSQIICFKKIGKSYVSGVKDYDGSSIRLNNTVTPKQASCFITERGTLMPQIIVPMSLSVNELSMMSDDPSADLEEFNSARARKVFHWNAESRVTEQLLEETDAKLHVALKNKQQYGRRTYSDETSTSSFISMIGWSKYIDRDGFKRDYVSNMLPTGAVAILVDIYGYDTSKEDAHVTFEIGQADADDSVDADIKDKLSITLSNQGDVTVGVNNSSSASGSVTFSDMGLATPLSASKFITGRSTLFVYSGLNLVTVTGDLTTSPGQSPKEISCVKDAHIDLASVSNPRIDRFPKHHKTYGTDSVVAGGSSLYWKSGNRIRATWVNCWGNFGLTLLRYTGRFSFCYLFRVPSTGLNVIDSDSSDHAKPEYSNYYCLIVAGNTSGYSGWQGKHKAEFLGKASNGDSIYKVDVTIKADSLQLKPIEILGMIRVTKCSGLLSDVRRDDGDFTDGVFNPVPLPIPVTGVVEPSGNTSDGFQSNSASMNHWLTYATDLSVSHGFDSGTSGSISVDKFALKGGDIGNTTPQSIGALTIDLVKYDDPPDDSEIQFSSVDRIKGAERTTIYKGYALEVSDKASDSGATVDISLEGLQRKLSDMVHVNCPYWDGDLVFASEKGSPSVLDYMVAYSGSRLNFVPEYSAGTVLGEKTSNGDPFDFVLPRSFDFSAPAVHFPIGTSVLDSIKQIAEKVNHQFVIQPDGEGYFYGMDEFGKPCWITNGPFVREFSRSDIISLDITPYMANRYNTFLTMALIGRKDPRSGSIFPDGSFPRGKLTELPQTPDNFPWSRIITTREAGIVTIDQLEKFHKRNISFSSRMVFTGSLAISGDNSFKIYDKIRIGSQPFYISAISHSISLSGKSWTTNLSVAWQETFD